MSNTKSNLAIIALLPAIRGTVAKILGPFSTSIDDIVNDTVVSLLAGGMERHDGRASLKGYACRAARNKALNHKTRACNRMGHDSVNGTDYDKGEDSAPEGVILGGVDGRIELERAQEASDLTRAMATVAAGRALLSADEQAFMDALETGVKIKDAGSLVGWTPVQATRRRVKIFGQLRTYAQR